MTAILNRKFWNPLLALSGGLTLISGLFLLFHLKSHFTMHIHQLSSIVFIAACAIHLVLNWKPLRKTLSSRTAWTLLAVLLFSGLGMAFSGAESDRGHRQTRTHWHR